MMVVHFLDTCLDSTDSVHAAAQQIDPHEADPYREFDGAVGRAPKTLSRLPMRPRDFFGSTRPPTCVIPEAFGILTVNEAKDKETALENTAVVCRANHRAATGRRGRSLARDHGRACNRYTLHHAMRAPSTVTREVGRC